MSRDKLFSLRQGGRTLLKKSTLEAVAIAENEEAQRIAASSPYTDNNPIVGIPAQVAEQFQAYVDLGVEYLIVRLVDFPNTAGIELFVQDVMPRLRTTTGDGDRRPEPRDEQLLASVPSLRSSVSFLEKYIDAW